MDNDVEIQAQDTRGIGAPITLPTSTIHRSSWTK